MSDFCVAILGASGLVGQTMLRALEERSFPVRELRLLASVRSAGTRLNFHGEEHVVQAVSAEAFEGVDIALFSAGSATSRQWASVAVQRGAVVIDNSSTWRMADEVPLIVPEVNPEVLTDNRPRIIANPNCSTIQMVVALRPLKEKWGLRRVFVATYQSVSGAGQKGIDQYQAELAGKEITAPILRHRVLNNAIPQIADILDDGSTFEEAKMIHETRKILEMPALPVSVTCVRIPVFNAHSEALHIGLENEYRLEDVRAALSSAPGIVLAEDIDGGYPLASEVSGRDEIFVGRLRRDPAIDNGLALWVVADNVRKGAAINAVQIAELWVEKHREQNDVQFLTAQ